MGMGGLVHSFVFLSKCLSLYLNIFVYMSLSIYMSLSMRISLSGSLSICHYLFICLCLCVCLCLALCLYVLLSIVKKVKKTQKSTKKWPKITKNRHFLSFLAKKGPCTRSCALFKIALDSPCYRPPQSVPGGVQKVSKKCPKIAKMSKKS